MDIRVHGKNMDIDDQIRQTASQKVARVERYLNSTASVDVEFFERHNPRIPERFGVEITTLAHGHTVRVEAVSGDERAALDIAVDKLERQLRRLKERVIQRSRQGANKRLNPSSPSTDEGEDSGRRIVRRKRFAMRPMSPEEAVLEMEMLGHDFFFFLDAETGKHCVLYHRNDGTLGLIEPE